MDDLCDRQDEDDCHGVSEALLWMEKIPTDLFR